MENKTNKKPCKGLLERLKDGGSIVIAEGYLLELERRGYLKCGGFVPEVVLENPEQVEHLHREFVHAGSDVVEAFQYYGHRDKLRSIGREDDLERLNRDALRMARKVADDTGTLMAGNLGYSGIYSSSDEESQKAAMAMFVEQVQWIAEEGADFIIAETFNYLGEAMLALDAIKKHGNGLPAVVTLTAFIPDTTLDDVPFPKACRQLEEAGAAVVGLNCSRGPATILPLLRDVRKAIKGPLAALPVPYRTKEDCRVWTSLTDADTGDLLYPDNINSCMCNRLDIRKFAMEAKEIGVQYIGLCCGNAPNFTRELAEVYGRTPEASKYSPDVSENVLIGKRGGEINKEAEKIRRFSLGDARIAVPSVKFS